MDKHTETVRTKITKKQKKKLFSTAKKQGVSVVEYIRNKIV